MLPLQFCHLRVILLLLCILSPTFVQSYEVKKEPIPIQSGFWYQLYYQLYLRSMIENSKAPLRCPPSAIPNVPFKDVLDSMLFHETLIRISKRYLPPLATSQTPPDSNQKQSVEVFKVLNDGTVCVGSEPLQVRMPKAKDDMISYLNVVNSFIRFINHQSGYPLRISMLQFAHSNPL